MAGFRRDACGSRFYDFGRMGRPGQKLDLTEHAPAPTNYRCPVDRESLQRYVVKGLEFEHCPACQHIWLDRREAEELASKVAFDGASVEGRCRSILLSSLLTSQTKLRTDPSRQV